MPKKPHQSVAVDGAQLIGSRVFPFGSTVYFVAYYRDQLMSQTSLNRIYRPDGSLYASWTQGSDPAHYSASYWYRYFTNFAPSGPAGVWLYEVTFLSQTYRTYFAMGGAPFSGTSTGSLWVDPQPAGQVSLGWGPSCLYGDMDYEVYEGTLGQFTSHTPRMGP